MNLSGAKEVFIKDNRAGKSVECEDSETPPFHICESPETGHIVAGFALRLTGVSHRQNNAGKTQSSREMEREKMISCLNSFFSSMSSSQRIDIIYASGHGSAKRASPLFKIICRSRGETKDAARDGVRRLWHNLSTFLRVLEKTFKFDPVSPSREESLFGNATSRAKNIRPTGILVPGPKNKAVGFLERKDPRDSETEVILPSRLTNVKFIDFASVAMEIFSYPGPFTLILSISPLSLSSDDLEKISGALDMLRDGSPSQIRREIIPEITNELISWIKNPSGFRVVCKAESDYPAPVSFLKFIADNLYLNRAVSFEEGCVDNDTGALTADSTPEETRKSPLDLRDCFNATFPVPFLIPDASALGDLGLDTFFEQSHFTLSDEGIVLGEQPGGRNPRSVRFRTGDRSRHCYVVGATGTGKSTLLLNMIVQDIRKGRGICLIDPHGDLYHQVLESIPKKREKDVALLDPCDFDHIAGINFLECDGPQKHIQMNFVVNEMIRIFDRIYNLKTTGGPVFEQYMRNAMLLVLKNSFPGPTLIDVVRLFEHSPYRQFLIEGCSDPRVVSFWTNMAERVGGEHALVNMGPYITSKLNQFTTNELIRPIIGQSISTINFREIIDEGGILLVNLSKGLIGELDAQLLGMLIIGKIFTASMGRINVRPESRKPMYIYVDEFQNFTTDTVAHLLSESRKFGLYLTLANQNLAQLSANSGRQNILDVVIGNVGTTLIFRMGPIDAENMEKYTRPELTAEDLQYLPDFHAAGRLLNDGYPGRPIVFKTLPFSGKQSAASVERIKGYSREKYARPRSLVEKEISGRKILYKNFFGESKEV